MTFKKVKEVLSEIPFINSGGCGISALAMYLWLQKNKGYAPEIVFCYQNACTRYSNNKRSIKVGRVTLEVPSHVAIIYKGKKYDCNGKVIRGKIGWGGYIFNNFHRVKFNELINTINRVHDWNDSFEREDYVPIIEKDLGIKLPIYK